MAKRRRDLFAANTDGFVVRICEELADGSLRVLLWSKVSRNERRRGEELLHQLRPPSESGFCGWKHANRPQTKEARKELEEFVGRAERRHGKRVWKTRAICNFISFPKPVRFKLKRPPIFTVSIEKVAANGFTPTDYKAFLKLGITSEIVERARLERVTKTQASELGISLDCDSGIKFPYFLPPLNGNNNTTKPVYYAVRQDSPPYENGETTRKYLFPPGKTYPYFAPAAPEFWANEKIPVIIVESQKAALATLRWAEDAHRPILPIAINGCWGWRGKVGIAPNESGEKVDQKDILGLLAGCCKGRRAYILYDANEATNFKVKNAREELVQRLLQGITTDVRILHLPPAVKTHWNGPDDYIGACGDEAFADLFEDVEHARRSVVESVLLDTSRANEVKDMPADCMSGELGQIYETYMRGFPRAYAYSALLANASALVQDRAPGVRTNIYVITVGKSRSGKTEADDWGRTILGVYDTNVIRAFVGSAEQFAVRFGDAQGNSRLFDPDEAAHLLQKAMLEHASFPYLLARAWKDDRFEITVSKQRHDQNYPIHMHLSFYGGIVEDNFEECFTNASVNGFYQRVFFGLGPTNFAYNYRPVPEELHSCRFRVPSAVKIAPEVWEQVDEWRKPLPTESVGIAEVCLRASVIAAAFDRKKILEVSDLEPMRHMIEYQKYVRAFLKPNLGVTTEGKITDKIMRFFESLPPGKGVTKRMLYNATHIHRLGVTTADRVVNSLIANGTLLKSRGNRSDSEIISLVTLGDTRAKS